MPLYFFHYHTPTDSARDDLGCSFDSLDLAYLDAYRSMIEMGAELLKQQVDPAKHRIEIADHDGRVLMELRFDEVFRPRPRLPHLQIEKEELRRRLQHQERLREELKTICLSARLSVSNAHETLRRAKAITWA